MARWSHILLALWPNIEKVKVRASHNPITTHSINVTTRFTVADTSLTHCHLVTVTSLSVPLEWMSVWNGITVALWYCVKGGMWHGVRVGRYHPISLTPLFLLAHLSPYHLGTVFLLYLSARNTLALLAHQELRVSDSVSANNLSPWNTVIYYSPIAFCFAPSQQAVLSFGKATGYPTK